ncbi:bifunctional glycosyltransferase/CDP-glycerol:glycerophosphate glycerophosphotransferase [Mammaliicoccus sciuri]|uniref:bifunctional glycosyltransferase/CDP-glycerol:glycerophosphate glycerophosphotransferase n=2 Tax=Mammaliicoccus sciuri TaxID=1296 RepID=UPI000E6A596A|nr:CDP-glycerol glycerophosphotransferase family protein [Mammaliicoccus sciuri]RIO09461.1 CDP-glycerol:glycerophosphate glycerophosphotransferase [Mammaliicoccus sciuri]
MLFSIVIAYKDNNIKYLKDCLKSIEDQTYKNFEVIFVHSKSAELVEALKSVNFDFKTIEVNEDTNLQSCRNIGIEKAKGDYLLFMDGDDFIHPYTLIYAKSLINEDESSTDVLKLGVKKTYYSMPLTFSQDNRQFYSDDTINKLDEIFESNDESNASSQEFINKMFESNIIKHSYLNISKKKFIDKLNYRFKLHGYIIRKDFITNHNLYLDETNYLYGDIPFIVSIYDLVDNIKQTKIKLYNKLIHNDDVNYPSLTQENTDVKSYYKLLAFDKALSNCSDMFIKKKIKEQACKEYIYTICKNADFKQSFNNALPIYNIMKDILNKPSANISLKRRHALELKPIKNKDYQLAYRRSKKRVSMYNVYNFMKPKNERLRKKEVQKNIFTKLLIKKDTIVYESFLGKNYSDSPKAIFKYLMSEYPDDWNHVWILNDKNLVKDDPLFQKKNVKIISRFSWSYFYYVTISKYFILNMRQPKWLEKKKNQIILSTWHGTPLKKLVFDMENITSASKTYKRDFYMQSRNWDYLIAANKYSESIFERAFMFPTSKILTNGYPRNDILTNHSEQYKEEIKKQLGLPLDKKVILYAPTWRDDEYHGVGKYKFTLNLDLQKLKENLGDEYIVILRMHYFISDNLDVSEFEGFVYDYSKYNDINDLYIASDMLITDYSSVFFDYANLRRPILFYTYDFEKYKNELRGFYINMEEDLPGPILYTTDEVIKSIKNIENVSKEFSEKYERFYDEFCILDDGQATKKTVEAVMGIK